MKYILSPSILAADFKELGKEIQATERGGAEYLHFDVMDGWFVPSISFGMPVLKSIRPCTKQIMDVHLMVEEPVSYVREFANLGADIITVHLEACEDVNETIERIRECGVKVGLSICPDTPVKELEPYFDKVDMILIMTVLPGFGGQKIIPETFDKIRELRKIFNEKGLQVDIQVDGGIKLSNVKEVLEAGANVIVAGSAVFNGHPEESTSAFMEILKDYE